MKAKPGRCVQRSLFALRSYVIFFLTVSFLVSCCLLLFLKGLDIPPDVLRQNARVTFLNVLLLSLLCCLVDGVRHKFMVERPVRRILEAAQRLTAGDFSARIQPLHGGRRVNEFDLIIEDLNKMARELAGTETLRTDFIANVSHELKTPLAVIQNYGTLLQTPALEEAQRMEYAKAAADAARRLSQLITNILKLNKLENQQIFPQARPYDLGEQLRECLLGFEEAWEKKDLALDAEGIGDVTVTADAELLTLVWNNLFSNAIKFTPPGGRVTVDAREEDGWAVVRVADTGCGIPPEVGRHIFEKFYQGDPSHAAQGNGLGLALVKRVVDITGGEILVESTSGKGSVFTVKLRRDVNEGL